MLSGWESIIDTIPSTSFCQPEANLLKDLTLIMTMGTLRLPCESIIHAIKPGLNGKICQNTVYEKCLTCITSLDYTRLQ